MNLILTFDYELYGDGSGDVFKQMITPTNQILRICDKYHIKTTIFFEVIEYIKLKSEWNNGNKMNYIDDPILAIERQLQKAFRNGHDIQLHVHPQWVNAIYSKNKWNVDFSNWRLGDFNVAQNYTIKDMLSEGKSVIENLLQQIEPEYKCEIIRAGGYNIMPSEEVYYAMLELGLKVDSSVYPGGFETGELSKYDYTKAPSDKDSWLVSPTDFAKESSNSYVREVPIFALNQRRFRKINIDRVKSAYKNKKSSINTIKSKTINRSKLNKIKYLFEKEAFTWDFCLFSYGMHRKYFKYINKNLLNKRTNFVLIGHPKSFTSDRAFIRMIHLAKRNNYSFVTLKSYYERNK